MSHRLNLAKRPFIDTRPVNVTAGLLIVIVVVLSFISVRTIEAYLDGSKRTREAIAAFHAEITSLEQSRRASANTLAHFNIKELSESAVSANLIAKRRSFSWMRFLTRLEKTLPAQVRVVSIGLVREESSSSREAIAKALTSENVPVQLDLVSQIPDGVEKCIRAFYASSWFDQPLPGVEQSPERGTALGRRITMTVVYKDSGRSDPASDKAGRKP